jgi:putative ABC transport system permease protein
MSSGDMMMNAKVEFAGSAKSFGAMRAERVGAGFFRTVGAPLRSGREFDDRDERDGASVILVNETMAGRVWPHQQAVGQTVELEGRAREVIGIVGDIQSAFPLAPKAPAVFRPATPSGFASPAMHGVTVLVRVVPGFDAPTRLRRLIEAIDPNVTVFRIKPVSDEIDTTLYFARFATFVYGGMGVFGLVLASVGLAGVTAYAVARRTNEIGIRIALGASRGSVLTLVLREGGVIILTGTMLGLAIALAATRALASSVEALAEATSTSISDPLVLLGGPALLGLVALVACYLPARRSMRIDPVVALRTE